MATTTSADELGEMPRSTKPQEGPSPPGTVAWVPIGPQELNNLAAAKESAKAGISSTQATAARIARASALRATKAKDAAVANLGELKQTMSDKDARGILVTDMKAGVSTTNSSLRRQIVRGQALAQNAPFITNREPQVDCHPHQCRRHAASHRCEFPATPTVALSCIDSTAMPGCDCGAARHRL